jgi:hypothetical protein
MTYSEIISFTRNLSLIVSKTILALRTKRGDYQRESLEGEHKGWLESFVTVFGDDDRFSVVKATLGDIWEEEVVGSGIQDQAQEVQKLDLDRIMDALRDLTGLCDEVRKGKEGVDLTEKQKEEIEKALALLILAGECFVIIRVTMYRRFTHSCFLLLSPPDS